MFLPTLAFVLIPACFAPFISSAAIQQRSEKVSYDGYKVFRIATGDDLLSVQEKLSLLSLDDAWNRDISRHIDFAVPPDQLASFDSLGLDVKVLHADLGADISLESANVNLRGMDFRS